MISRYGYDVVGVVLVLVIAVVLLSWFFVDWRPLKFSLMGVAIAFLFFTLYFFRDPDREPPQGEGIVISPADGEVVLVKDVQVDEYVRGDATQISIFMSPLDVHVNRFPITGTVGYFRYFPGEYIVAYDEKSSLRNERTHIGVENDRVRVLFKQIAGFVARRIVAEVKEGDRAVVGERFGMIKFGSRLDVILPRSVVVKAQVGDRTVAGETVLAVIP